MTSDFDFIIAGYDCRRDAGDCVFDEASAMRTVKFIETHCRFTRGKWAGKPYVLSREQRAITTNLFGWKRPDNSRRYREFFLTAARKFGKTEFESAIGGYLLLADNEPTPVILSCAGNFEQAHEVFDAMTAMIEQSPQLAKHCTLQKKEITTDNGGLYKCLNAEGKTKHGSHPSGGFADEVHAIKSPLVIDAIVSGMGARWQPMMGYATTAGDDPDTPCYEVYERAVRVRDGLDTAQNFLPAIFEAPTEDDPGDPATWRKAQPNLGVTVSMDFYAEKWAEAKGHPRKLSIFRQWYLNQWAFAPEAFLTLDEWRALDKAPPIESLSGCDAYMGIDLSATCDTTAVAIAIPRYGKMLLYVFMFLPEDSAGDLFKREKNDRAPYRQWLRDGHMIATDGNVIDYAAIIAKVEWVLGEGIRIRECVADNYNLGSLVEPMQRLGIPLKEIRQGFSLSEATKAFERLVKNGELQPVVNPAFTWQICGVCVKRDEAGNYWPSKKRSTSRIDAPVASIEAIYSAMFGAGKTAYCSANTQFELVG